MYIRCPMCLLTSLSPLIVMTPVFLQNADRVTLNNDQNINDLYRVYALLMSMRDGHLHMVQCALVSYYKKETGFY